MTIKDFKETPYTNKDMELVRQRALRYINQLEEEIKQDDKFIRGIK